MTTCPLPIDWLDFLEDNDLPELADHLSKCRSCQEVVSRLRSAAAQSIPVSGLSAIGPKLVPQEVTSVAPGDMFVTSDSFKSSFYHYAGLDRLIVLVLRSTDEVAGHRWFDVIPASIDVDNSIPTDILVDASDTTISRPLCLDMAQQITVSAQQLGWRLGTLTETGDAVVRAAVDGQIDLRRTGPVLEGEDDPRLVARQESARIIRTLSGPRSRVIEAGLIEQAQVWPKVLFLTVKGVRRTSAHKVLAASAQSHSVFIATLAKQTYGVELSGELRTDPDDNLWIHFSKAAGWTSPMRAVVHRQVGHAVTSQAFLPVPGHDVILVRRQNLFPKEVTGIELRLE